MKAANKSSQQQKAFQLVHALGEGLCGTDLATGVTTLPPIFQSAKEESRGGAVRGFSPASYVPGCGVRVS